MDLAALNEKIRPIAEEISIRGGFEFVKSEIGGTKRNPIVRVFIDRLDGLTVEHCADVSRELEERLDADDLIPTKYVLEVSSPGLERELTKPADFERFNGKLAKIKTRRGNEDAKTYVGTIDGVEGDNVILDVKNIGRIEVALEDIDKANLKLDLEAELKKKPEAAN